jgi:DNA-directed RNA polymerase specialized sigma24 family protein
MVDLVQGLEPDPPSEREPLPRRRVGRRQGIGVGPAKLPERYRVPLALAYYADADYDEIATTLGITRTHVGVLLCRAKQMLRQSLADAGRDARGRATQGAVADAGTEARGRTTQDAVVEGTPS